MGICKLEGSELCIITEFMPKGNLNKILRDKSINLTWETKIKIAIDIW